MRTIYADNFYKDRHENTSYAASVIPDYCVDFLRKNGIEISSAIDIGCGVGTWLSVLRSTMGEKLRVHGLDGGYINKEYLRISQNEFSATDFEKENVLDEKYDLAISLEVAEHLSPSKGVDS